MSQCIGEGCTHSSHKAIPELGDCDERFIGVDLASGPDRTAVSFVPVLDERREVNLPADDSPSKNVKLDKKILHRKMRRLGMGKHVGGNAHSLANHKRVPGEIVVGEGKTKAQFQAEQRAAKKRKNKMARKSRRRNRR